MAASGRKPGAADDARSRAFGRNSPTGRAEPLDQAGSARDEATAALRAAFERQKVA